MTIQAKIFTSPPDSTGLSEVGWYFRHDGLEYGQMIYKKAEGSNLSHFQQLAVKNLNSMLKNKQLSADIEHVVASLAELRVGA